MCGSILVTIENAAPLWSIQSLKCDPIEASYTIPSSSDNIAITKKYSLGGGEGGDDLN